MANPSRKRNAKQAKIQNNYNNLNEEEHEDKISIFFYINLPLKSGKSEIQSSFVGTTDVSTTIHLCCIYNHKHSCSSHDSRKNMFKSYRCSGFLQNYVHNYIPHSIIITALAKMQRKDIINILMIILVGSDK